MINETVGAAAVGSSALLGVMVVVLVGWLMWAWRSTKRLMPLIVTCLLISIAGNSLKIYMNWRHCSDKSESRQDRQQSRQQHLQPSPKITSCNYQRPLPSGQSNAEVFASIPESRTHLSDCFAQNRVSLSNNASKCPNPPTPMSRLESPTESHSKMGYSWDIHVMTPNEKS